MTAERQKERTLEALATQMERLSRQQPVLLIFEDIHWADPTSLDLLELNIECAQSIPVMVVLTYRPEFTAPWSGYTHITTLTLNRFARSLASAMVENITGGKHLPDEVLEQIINKTDGVPLFVEELTKTILESGVLTEESNRYVATGSLGDIAIPATLHDSLMARLDRLGAVKEVAQMASVIGREFDSTLLGGVSPLNVDKLRDALNQLIDVGLVFRRGRSEEGAYIFKHALVQDAAYGSLLKSRRQNLHGDIARTLENRFPARVASEPELLAHHLTEADLTEPATRSWLKAGQLASRRFANPEAVRHLQSALKVLDRVPSSIDRDRLELDIQLALISPLKLTSTKGYAGDEVKPVRARTRELCIHLGDDENLARVLCDEHAGAYGAENYQITKDVGVEVLQLNEQRNDSLGVISGIELAAWGAFGLGEFSLLQSYADRILEIYDPVRHGLDRSLAIGDHKVAALWESEILRLKTEVCMRDVPTHHEHAESLLRKAMQVARRQEAKSLELRSSVDLGKLWQQQDKRQKAHDLVAPIYDWFTEGFDTPDLKEAKALLEQLT